MEAFPSLVEKRPVVFLAPGSGLGHLVRTGALSLGLTSRGIPSVILTSSPYGPGFSRLAGLHVVTFSMARWKDCCARQVDAMNPAVIVQDTFACGLKGENLQALSQSYPLLVLARRLRFTGYMDALKSPGPRYEPRGFTALVLEPLSPRHRDWLETRAREIVPLENRIRFPFSQLPLPPVPRELDRALEAGDLHLVVHSGPESEIRRLIDCAEAGIRERGRGRLAVINPRLAAENRPMCFDYFPAAALFPRAYHIYTGAGFNTVAETAGFKDKHTMMAFPRHYDDQLWRKNQKNEEGSPGNATALRVIEELYVQEQRGVKAG